VVESSFRHESPGLARQRHKRADLQGVKDPGRGVRAQHGLVQLVHPGQHRPLDRFLGRGPDSLRGAAGLTLRLVSDRDARPRAVAVARRADVPQRGPGADRRLPCRQPHRRVAEGPVDVAQGRAVDPILVVRIVIELDAGPGRLVALGERDPAGERRVAGDVVGAGLPCVVDQVQVRDCGPGGALHQSERQRGPLPVHGSPKRISAQGPGLDRHLPEIEVLGAIGKITHAVRYCGAVRRLVFVGVDLDREPEDDPAGDRHPARDPRIAGHQVRARFPGVAHQVQVVDRRPEVLQQRIAQRHPVAEQLAGSLVVPLHGPRLDGHRPRLQPAGGIGEVPRAVGIGRLIHRAVVVQVELDAQGTHRAVVAHRAGDGRVRGRQTPRLAAAVEQGKRGDHRSVVHTVHQREPQRGPLAVDVLRLARVPFLGPGVDGVQAIRQARGLVRELPVRDRRRRIDRLVPIVVELDAHVRAVAHAGDLPGERRVRGDLVVGRRARVVEQFQLRHCGRLVVHDQHRGAARTPQRV